MSVKRSPLWVRILPDRIVCGLATMGRIGYWGKAPGTNGSVVGLLLYTLIFHHLAVPLQLLLGAFLVWLAVVICGEAEQRMQKRDPGEIILDEVVAVPLCFIGLSTKMAFTGHMWAYMLMGFAVFRLFDIAKPFGVDRLQRYQGGWGVVADDVAAAGLTFLALHGMARIWIELFV